MIPPDLAAALGGAATGNPNDPQTVGVPSNASITSRDEGGDLDHIRTPIMALQAYAENNHDDQELAAVHKCIVALQNILAGHAKNRDAAMGVTPALKHVRRTSGGPGIDHEAEEAVRVRACRHGGLLSGAPHRGSA
jgi:hypothetical protein